MFFGSHPPPPPPPPEFYEEPLVIGIAATALAAFLIILTIVRWTGSTLTAVCELGVAGHPSDWHSKKAISPQGSFQKLSTADRRPSAKQFVPERASKVSGCVKLVQVGGTCTIEYHVSGLTPGLHGFHITESADFSNGCVSAGPIYNPFKKNHGGPPGAKGPMGPPSDSSDRMVGDLGNIEADTTGTAKGVTKSNLVKLKGPYTVVGRSFMVHADPDDLGNGDNPKSKVTGNSGARIACGEIKLI